MKGVESFKRVSRVALALATLIVGVVGLAPQGSAQEGDSRYFPETKQTVKGWFWRYWQEHGGLAQQGYPLSGEMQERSDLDGKMYVVQYFERAVFELHPENQRPYDVLLSQLGTFRYKQKYGTAGAPGQKANTDAGTLLFPETGKKLGGSFLAYWQRNGGLAQQGFPISDEFQERSDLDGKTYTVQYFERAVFEWHPENQPPYNVLLSQLGTFRMREKYQQGGGTPPGPLPVREWISPANLSRSKLYNNVPSVAAPVGGEVTVGWEQRDEAGGVNNTVVVGFNDPAGALRATTLQSSGFKQSGSVKAARDSLGRKHLVWWGQSGANVCNYYARIEVDGRRGVQEEVPGSCGRNQKLVAISVGPDNTVHALFGRDGVAVYYYHRTEGGAWDARDEKVTEGGIPGHVAIAVSNGGVVMAAWRTGAGPIESNVYTATRGGNGAWAAENISGACCVGCPGSSWTYLPSLAADGAGGFRLVWADEQCEPRTDPRQNDLYYREWVGGRGWLAPPARIVRDRGDAFESAIAVDASGALHIVYGSDPGTGVREHGNYRLFYVSGSGASFSAPAPLFPGWAANATFHKSPALDYSAGWLHLVFNSDHEGNKEVYYSNKGVGR